MAARGLHRRNHDISEIEGYRKKFFEYELKPDSFWKKYFGKYYSAGYRHFVEYRINELNRVVVTQNIDFDASICSLNDKPGLLYAFKVPDYLRAMDHIETFINRRWENRIIDRVLVGDFFTIFIHLGDKYYEK